MMSNRPSITFLKWSQSYQILVEEKCWPHKTKPTCMMLSIPKKTEK